jgi:hypothetical protein
MFHRGGESGNVFAESALPGRLNIRIQLDPPAHAPLSPALGQATPKTRWIASSTFAPRAWLASRDERREHPLCRRPLCPERLARWAVKAGDELTGHRDRCDYLNLEVVLGRMVEGTDIRGYKGQLDDEDSKDESDPAQR